MLAIDTRARARTLSFSHKHSLLDFPFLVIADGDFIVIRTFSPTLSVSVTGGNSAKKKKFLIAVTLILLSLVVTLLR